MFMSCTLTKIEPKWWLFHTVIHLSTGYTGTLIKMWYYPMKSPGELQEDMLGYENRVETTQWGVCNPLHHNSDP